MSSSFFRKRERIMQSQRRSPDKIFFARDTFEDGSRMRRRQTTGNEEEEEEEKRKVRWRRTCVSVFTLHRQPWFMTWHVSPGEREVVRFLWPFLWSERVKETNNRRLSRNHGATWVSTAFFLPFDECCPKLEFLPKIQPSRGSVCSFSSRE